MVAASLAKDWIANGLLDVGRVFGSIIHILDDKDLRYMLLILLTINERGKARS